MELKKDVDAASVDPIVLRKDASPVVICNYIYELENAISFVTDECRLSNPVKVNYEIVNGEGFIRIETITIP